MVNLEAGSVPVLIKNRERRETRGVDGQVNYSYWWTVQRVGTDDPNETLEVT